MPDAEPETFADDGDIWVTPTVEPFRFNLRTALLAMAAVAVILGFGRMFVIRANAHALSASCRNELKQISLGIFNHESAMGYLPAADVLDPSGKPLSSWRFRVVPFLMSTGWRSNFRDAWNAPSNRIPAQETFDVYCWNRSVPTPSTSVFAVTGPDTVFDGTHRKLADVPPDLVLLIEVRDSQTHWMQPGDYNVTDLLAYRGRIGDHLHGVLPDRLHVLFADGINWVLDADAPIADLQPFLTITGAKSHDRDQLLAPHKVD
jgi:hypothetical protein